MKNYFSKLLSSKVDFLPQTGRQAEFLATKADIAIYGGSAGAGKTYALLLEAARHTNNPNFTALFLRRNTTQIRNQGGLWDESLSIYPTIKGAPKQHELKWVFKSGANVKFAHLEYDSTVYNYQGAQVALICWDELTHFTQSQFFYMLSRNRSTCGVSPYMRATCNPDRDSWVRKFIDWWIDPTTGYAIKERAGIIRYFIRRDGEIFWADTAEELGVEDAKSVTFIPATLADNKILMEKDPSYLANLKAQNKVEKERLLYGNWNISYSSLGSVINREDFNRFDLNYFPQHIAQIYFVMDTAAKTAAANDYSVIGLFARTNTGQYYILDWFRGKLESPALEEKMIDMWHKHAILSPQGIFIEDASVGTALLQRLRRNFPVFALKPIKDKFMRLNDVLGIIKSKFVYIPTNVSWAEDFFTECECFRATMDHILMDKEEYPHDDQVDVLAYGLSRYINVIKPFIPTVKTVTPHISPIFR